MIRKISIFTVIMLLLFLSGCRRDRGFRKINGRWVLNSNPRYSFSPLGPGWFAIPISEEKDGIFCVKKFVNYIGVASFIPSQESYKPEDVIKHFLKDDFVVLKKVTIIPVMSFGDNGYIGGYKTHLRKSKSSMRSFESFVAFSTLSSEIVLFTFKKHLDPGTRDFRKVSESKILEEVADVIPTFNEFLSFCKSFEEKETLENIMEDVDTSSFPVSSDPIAAEVFSY